MGYISSVGFLKALFVLGTVAGVWSLFLTLFSEPIAKTYCVSALYSSYYAICTAGIESSLSGSVFPLGLFALFVATFILLLHKPIRVFLLRSLKFYAPVAAIFIGIGIFVPFCLGWLGCSSLLPTVVANLKYAAIILVFVAILQVLFLNRNSVFISIVCIVAGLTLFHASIAKIDEFSKYIYYHQQHMPPLSDAVGGCTNAKYQREVDHCLNSVGIRKRDHTICNTIVSLDFRIECHDLIYRKQSIENLDRTGCSLIFDSGQRSLCNKLIRERQEQNKK